jgi:CubicO group peptidase (beta-lactamase class C family)
MKLKSSVTILLLAVSFAQIASAPVVATRAQSSSVEERIRRVENGLMFPVAIKGQSAKGMNILDRMKRYKAPGVSVAVIENSAIAWARGYGLREAGTNRAVTAETLFQAASISKPVAVTAALRLIEEGRLSLDEDVNLKLKSWKVPENEFTKEEKVTIRRLTSHSAGLTVHGFPGYAAESALPSVVQILDGEPPANTRPVRVDAVPGARWRYSGGGTTLLQLLLIDVTGKPFPQIMRETVLSRAGMRQSTYEQPLPQARWEQAAAGHRPNGEKIKGNFHTYPEMAAAGLWTTPSDLARFAIEIQKSKAGKSKFLSKSMVDEMLTRQSGDYGLGVGLAGEGRNQQFSHGGSNEGFRCFMVAYSHLGKGVVVMTNSDNGDRLVFEIVRAVAREYGWPDYKQIEREMMRLDPEALKPYVGEYQLAPTFSLKIEIEGDHLTATPTGQMKIDLYPESELKFFAAETQDEIAFVKSDGKINELTARLFGRNWKGIKLK